MKKFLREPNGIDQSNLVSDQNTIYLDGGHEIRTKLLALLTGEGDVNSVEIPRLYPPYVKVPGKGKAAPVPALLIGNF